jgi:site-specific recombinase XerD
MYLAGLRLTECLQLRVHDMDFRAHQITAHDGKGVKDRLTLLLTAIQGPLRQHLARVR